MFYTGLSFRAVIFPTDHPQIRYFRQFRSKLVIDPFGPLNLWTTKKISNMLELHASFQIFPLQCHVDIPTNLVVFFFRFELILFVNFPTFIMGNVQNKLFFRDRRTNQPIHITYLNHFMCCWQQLFCWILFFYSSNIRKK